MSEKKMNMISISSMPHLKSVILFDPVSSSLAIAKGELTPLIYLLEY